MLMEERIILKEERIILKEKRMILMQERPMLEDHSVDSCFMMKKVIFKDHSIGS